MLYNKHIRCIKGLDIDCISAAFVAGTGCEVLPLAAGVGVIMKRKLAGRDCPQIYISWFNCGLIEVGRRPDCVIWHFMGLGIYECPSKGLPYGNR